MEVITADPLQILYNDSLYNDSTAEPDNTTSEAQCGSENFTPNLVSKVAYLLISSFGIGGNVLVIVVILNAKMMKKWFTNILILNQSAIDLFASVVILTIAVQPHRPIRRHLSGPTDEVLCRVWYSTNLLWSSIVASSYNLVAIAFERYGAVVYPLVYRQFYTHRRARAACVIPWCIFIVMVAYSTGIVDGRCCLNGAFYTDRTAKFINGFLALFFEYLLPTAIYIFCYTSMYKALRRTVHPEESTTGPVAMSQLQNRNQRIRNNIFKTQVAVVVGFLLCWFINQILYGAFNFGYSIDFTSNIYHFSVICVFFNCCLNPFIYALKYEMFQQGLRQLFRRQVASENSSVVQTTASVITVQN